MRSLTQSGRENLAAVIAMIPLTAVMLIIRFAIRASQRQMPFGADWLCLFSAVPFYLYCGFIIHYILSTSVDGSFDINVLPGFVGLAQIVNVLKASYKLEILFGIVLTTVKLSILWFYWKVFATNSGQNVNKRMIQAAAILCVVWFLTATFVVVFQCKPINAYWNNFAQAPYCLNSPKMLLGYEITNLFVDVFILCIPLPIVWKLHLQTSKKAGLVGIFLLGAFVCVASICRLTAIWHPPNYNTDFNFSHAFVWSTLQMGLAITCACLPTLAPVLPIIAKPFQYIRSWSQSVWSKSNVASSGHGHGHGRGHGKGARGYKVSDEFELTREQQQQQLGGGHPAPGTHFYGASQSWARGNPNQSYHSNGNSNGNGRSQFYDDAEAPMPPRGIMVNRNVEVS